MSFLPAKALGPRIRHLMSSAARQIASAIGAPGGQGTLPTKSQLTKMGPQSAITRGSPHTKRW